MTDRWAGRGLAVLAALGLGVVALVLLRGWIFRDVDAVGSVARGPIIYAGTGTQTTQPFHLSGGSYHLEWSAWGKAAEFPPCTHSAELMAVDDANATTSPGHVADLAKFAHVPATGGSDETYLINVKPGDYYLRVDSECSWQISVTRN